MFVKRDCFEGGWGRGVGNFFCKCKINGHTLHAKKTNQDKAKNPINNSPDWEPGELASGNDLVNVYDNF